MADERALNGLGMGMKAFVAAEVAFNSNFGELSRRNGAADTENIMTLADYMKKEKPEELKNWNPELRDDNKLMRTYVVPMTMPNGQRIDLVVNSRGRDIAQIYIDEEGGKRFHLDNSVKKNIRLMTEGAIDKDKGYEREFIPKNLEELAEKISKDELVPKNQENVKERKAKVDRQAFERNSEDEKSVEEVAETLNVDVKALERFCEDNQISPNSVKGESKVIYTEELEKQLGTKLTIPLGSEIVALRVNDVDASTKLAIIDLNGNTLDFNQEHEGERDESELLAKLVPEGANGRDVQDTNETIENTIKLEDEEENVNEFEVEVDHEGDKAYFEEMYNKIKEKEKSAIEEIKNDTSLNNAERDRMIADIKADSYAQLEVLQRDTKVIIPSLSKTELADAQEAENRAEMSEVLQVGENTVRAVGKAILGDNEPEAFEVPGKRTR